MIDALHYEFVQNALLAGLLVSIACGIIGSLIVVNRMVMLSGGVAHAAYGGIGLAIFCGLSPFLGAGLFSVAVALIMGILTLKNRERADTIIGVIWAVGMAIGIISIDLSPGYNVDLMSYLFGSILTVSHNDLWLMAGLDIIILGVIFLRYREFIAMSYDEEFAGLRGIPVRRLYFTLLVLSALTVVVTIQVVGLILVIALVTIPPYLAEQYTRSLGQMMVVSTAFSALFTVVGLYLSYRFNLTSGATIIMVAAVVYGIVFGIGWLRR